MGGIRGLPNGSLHVFEDVNAAVPTGKLLDRSQERLPFSFSLIGVRLLEQAAEAADGKKLFGPGQHVMKRSKTAHRVAGEHPLPGIDPVVLVKARNELIEEESGKERFDLRAVVPPGNRLRISAWAQPEETPLGL